MAIRLTNIATQLNISRERAVEFLKKKNLIEGEISENPKLNESQENALRKEFSSDMAAKEKAEQFIKPKEKKEKAPKAETAEKEKKQEFKPLGKIDLDDLDGKKAKAKAEAEQKAAQEAKAAEEAKAKAEAQAAAKAAAKAVKAAQEAQLLAKAKAEAIAMTEPKSKKAEKKDEKPAPKPEKNADKPVQPKVEDQPAPTPEETTESEQTEQNGPKILGKIDLSSINSSTRPKKKSKEERRKEREEKAKAAQGQRQGGNGEKKKRERINKNKVDINQAAKQANQQANQQGGGKNKNKKNKNKKGNVQPEVRDEDVAKQVKETLARLTSKNKTNKNAAKYRRDKRDAVAEQAAKQAAAENAESKVLKLTEFVTVSDLATMMNVGVTQVIGTLMSVGVMASINQRLEAETINLVAEEFGFQTEYVSAEVQEAIVIEEDNEEDLIARAPVVTVMGHVDHGKTSLLDYIRSANVIAGEAGGITQHIGAYNVKLDDGRRITFLDTPGHEAFTAMRARGTQVTDIAIIIIAADDSVMPTTKEAIAHAQAADVPMVFAINKIDKPGANPDKIREDLSQMNLLVEEWGGKYQCQEISAKKGIGVEELLEKVLLEAEMLDLKANPNRKANGSIIESSLDKGRGYVATVLVQNGTLKV
ncbi:MAG: translation initiation factor IF-2 N-terminal domain-containing protein, partial [Bacteroidaceae bacterium]|nr:translation initiation factor IF-2 N-terminal domain-containing protein [Bacteroidaceae bacterium]